MKKHPDKGAFYMPKKKGTKMARIEYGCCEQKMADLRGFCKTWADPEKNPYTTDKLHDDDFNFISGMNYVLSYLTDLFLDYREDFINDEDSESMKSFKQEIVKKTIEEFAQFGYYDIEELITTILDSYEYEEDE